MTQIAQEENQPNAPQGMPFPMPGFPPMSGFPPMPGFPPAPGAQQPSAPQMPFPMPGTQQPPQMPFPMPSNPDDQLPMAFLGMMLPTPAPMPQPYELYEQALKSLIDVLGKMLAQSEATHPEDDSESDDEEGTDQQSASAPGPIPPMPPMPDLGSLMQPPSPGSEIGMMPRNTPIGSLMGLLFGASNTDYFYED